MQTSRGAAAREGAWPAEALPAHIWAGAGPLCKRAAAGALAARRRSGSGRGGSDVTLARRGGAGGSDARAGAPEAGGGGGHGGGSAAAGAGAGAAAPAVQPVRAERLPAGQLGRRLPPQPLLPPQRAGQHLHARGAAGGVPAAGAGGAAVGPPGRGLAGAGSLRGLRGPAAGQRRLPRLHEPPGRRRALPAPAGPRPGRRRRRQRPGRRAHHLLRPTLPAGPVWGSAGRLWGAVRVGAVGRRGGRQPRRALGRLRRPDPLPLGGGGAAGRRGAGRPGGAGPLRPYGGPGATWGAGEPGAGARAMAARRLRLLGQQPPAHAPPGGPGHPTPALGGGRRPPLGRPAPLPPGVTPPPAPWMSGDVHGDPVPPSVGSQRHPWRCSATTHG